MGKTAKWFRGLLGLNKKPIDTSSPQPGYSPAPKSSKKKWSFVKSYKEKDHYYESSGVYPNDTVGDDPNKHAIAVAAATAAVAEAAVAAAHAAAAVVRLTSSGRATTTSTPATSVLSENATIDGGSGGGPAGSVNSWMHIRRNGANYGSREVRAAIMIQSHFRAYLSRRALRALKALVKLQALVRGHIIRKQTADMIRRMQALLRVQARARAGRSHIFDSPLSVSKYTISDPSTPTPEKFKRNGSRKGISDKIVEIDTGKGGTHPTVKRRSLFHSSHLSLGSEHYSHSFTDSTAHQSILSPTSHSFVDYFTADSSPFKKGSYTSAKSDTSGCSDQPNYMSVTESSRAKIQMRSMSAPKQRINNNYDRSSSMKRYSIHGFNVQKVSNLHDNFTNKAYPGSGRLDRLGLPVGEDGGIIGYSGGFSGEQWHRY